MGCNILTDFVYLLTDVTYSLTDFAYMFDGKVACSRSLGMPSSGGSLSYGRDIVFARVSVRENAKQNVAAKFGRSPERFLHP